MCEHPRKDKGYRGHFTPITAWAIWSEGSRNVLSLSTSSLSEKQKLSPTSQAKPPTSMSIPLSVERSEACCADRGWHLAANASTSKRFSRFIRFVLSTFTSSAPSSSVCLLLLVPCAPELIFSGLCSCSIEWVPSFRGSDSWVMGNFRSFLQIFVLLTLGFVGEGVKVINRLC